MEKREVNQKSRYLVSITGENTNFEVPIDKASDLEAVEEILKVLKKKLQSW